MVGCDFGGGGGGFHVGFMVVEGSGVDLLLEREREREREREIDKKMSRNDKFEM